MISLESKQPSPDQHKPKFEYWKMPELKPGILPSLSGFAPKKEAGHWPLEVKKFFEECIVEAIKDPQWLLIPALTDGFERSEEYKERMAKDLPSTQHSSPKYIANLRTLSNSSELNTVALEINELRSSLDVGYNDIMMRAYEIMAQKYPELRFLRGASFDEDHGFTGIDFSPGSLSTALNYAKGVYGERRLPVLVSVKFTDVVGSYVRGKLNAYSEGRLYRDSLALERVWKIKGIEVYRVGDAHSKDEVLKDFEARAIKV